MKSCVNCGNLLEDHARFCNVCGANQLSAPQQIYQQPVYSQPNPGAHAPFKAPVWSIGLFVFLSNLLVWILSNIVSTVLLTLGMAVATGVVSIIMRLVYHVLFVLFAFIGFSIYNRNCRRMGHPRKKLSLGWVGIPLLLRMIFGFTLSFLWSMVFPQLVYNGGIPTARIGVLVTAYNIVSMLVSGLLNWLISCAILKAVVKNR